MLFSNRKLSISGVNLITSGYISHSLRISIYVYLIFKKNNIIVILSYITCYMWYDNIICWLLYRYYMLIIIEERFLSRNYLTLASDTHLARSSFLSGLWLFNFGGFDTERMSWLSLPLSSTLHVAALRDSVLLDSDDIMISRLLTTPVLSATTVSYLQHPINVRTSRH